MVDSKSGMLIEDELRRYERHIKIFGEEGQEKLKNAMRKWDVHEITTSDL